MKSVKTAAPASMGWEPYEPSPEAPWDLRRVVHLHRRAGFAATREEIERDLRDGPGPSVARVLEGRGQATGVLAEHESILERVGDAAVASRSPDRLKAWWVLRMLAGPDALGERLALMWHGRFATSVRKVQDLGAMRSQNELFRRHARSPFGELLTGLLRDPALLIWLDAPANRKGHPNENLARELMELFTIGVGRFDEADVREVARALTGLTVDRGSFVQDDSAHDPGEKTVLGRTGPWRPADVERILLEHPATAARLAELLCETFMGEGAVGSSELAALSDGLRADGLHVGRGVSALLRSRAFFSEPNIRSRVAGPVEFVVGTVRVLGVLDPPPSTLRLADSIARMGQDLFTPPNVGGWRGGRAWLNTRAMVARTNFAAALAAGGGAGAAPPDLTQAAGLVAEGRDLGRVVAGLAEAILGDDPGPAWRAAIVEAASADGRAFPDSTRAAAALILSSPEAQLA